MLKRIKLLKLLRIQIILNTLLVLSQTPIYSQINKTEIVDTPKIGLVLSGGGALGFAHIPILKAIDSLQIPIDYIAGASMGGIVSALYSIGYTGIELEHLVKSVDWEEILSDKPSRDLIPYFLKKDDGFYQLNFGLDGYRLLLPSGLIRGQKISLFFSKLTYPYEKIQNFDRLPIPYRCIAVDLLTANEVVLKDGSLSKAMRSTMAIPTIFNPVIWGDSLLIDGGLLNNMPVDVVKKMGADYVIAVNVGRPLKSRSELKSMFSMLEQTLTIPSIKKRNENINNTDLFIKPKLRGYNPADFDRKNIEEIIAIGEEAARIALPKLIELKHQYTFGEKSNNIIKSDSITVFNVNITGNTSITFKQIYDLFDVKPGDLFSLDILASHLQNLRNTEAFKSIKYKLTYLDSNNVGIHIFVKELGIPKIHRITIRNNRLLSFNKIYSQLGLKVGSILDIDLLNERINELYSLGHFENISYEIAPVRENDIHLIIYVEEKPRDALRLGLHYDETNKFIGSINIIKSNLFYSGLRNESTLKLAGLTKFNSLLYVPSSKHGISLYPFMRFIYKDIPMAIYGDTGRKIAIYHNRSSSIGAGLGVSVNHNWDTKIEYNVESMNITPIISYPDPILFPEWKDGLNTIRIMSHFDNLDNVLIPNQGLDLKFYYESSNHNIGSDLNYTRMDFSLNYYMPISKTTTVHFYTYYGYGTEKLPVYKWHYVSGPNSFVSAERDEFAWYRTSIFRADYRKQFRRNFYFSLIYNIAPNYKQNFYPIDLKVIQGFGIGLKYKTALGPIEIIYGRGDPIKLIHTSTKNDVYYFSMGYNF